MNSDSEQEMDINDAFDQLMQTHYEKHVKPKQLSGQGPKQLPGQGPKQEPGQEPKQLPKKKKKKQKPKVSKERLYDDFIDDDYDNYY